MMTPSGKRPPTRSAKRATPAGEGRAGRDPAEQDVDAMESRDFFMVCLPVVDPASWRVSAD